MPTARFRPCCCALIVAGALAGCAAPPPAPARGPLMDRYWELARHELAPDMSAEQKAIALARWVAEIGRAHV